MAHSWVYHTIHMGIEASNIRMKHVHMFCFAFSAMGAHWESDIFHMNLELKPGRRRHWGTTSQTSCIQGTSRVNTQDGLDGVITWGDDI